MSTREYRSMICDACGRESQPVKWPDTPDGWAYWEIKTAVSKALAHLCPECVAQVAKFVKGEDQ